MADVNTIDGRFVLVDNEHVTFMLMDGDQVHPSYDTAVWAKTPSLTENSRYLWIYLIIPLLS